MLDPYYCKLYIDTDSSINDMESAIDRAMIGLFSEIKITYPVFRNENFNAESRNIEPYDFIECSRYYVELETVHQNPGHLEGFQLDVATLVGNIRNQGSFVTASCDFEDTIADATGWNWTQTTPNPPGRSTTIKSR